jgi:hypothetical protein
MGEGMHTQLRFGVIVLGPAALALLLGAALARGDTITFSGSGHSGTFPTPPGMLAWRVEQDLANPARDAWGIPEPFHGLTAFGGSTSHTVFTVTFTNLPSGVTITPILNDVTTGDGTQFYDFSNDSSWEG